MRPKTLILFLIIFISIYGVDCITFLQDFMDSSNITSNNNVETARGRRRRRRRRRKCNKEGGDKYMMPLMLGSLFIKSIIFPLAFKVLAVMSGVAVLLSTMGLIVSSIVGFLKLTVKSKDSPVKVVHKIPHSTWSKDDNLFKNLESYNMASHTPQ